MCEQYANQQLEIPNEQTDWQSWASGLLGIDTFAGRSIPSPYRFDNWDEWAEAMVNVMNGGI